MKLISNAKCGKPVENGTVFDIEGYGFNICIHKIIGCGETWYLNCDGLNIDNLPLKSKNLFDCVKETKEIIKRKLDTLNKRFYDFYNDDSKMEISRY